MFIRSINSLTISQFNDNSDGGLSTPGSCKSSTDNELLTPTSPTSSNSSIYLPPTDNYSSMEYTSFPNLEKFSDEGWTEVRIEKFDPHEIQMESYDEMLVGGVRFQYS
ncbi:4489_t:CDS:1 [Diversispora eburnea]|uniref:4489_t:CDS:1 n=1 Tax=Diversispora eburnea TaxID=1213867 RepID=A0A9N8WIX9_9GLOM|nr:4489_t:CDS:1 [Diversispora eburnea]